MVIVIVALVAVVVSTDAGNKHTTLLSIGYVKYPLLIFKYPMISYTPVS